VCVPLPNVVGSQVSGGHPVCAYEGRRRRSLLHLYRINACATISTERVSEIQAALRDAKLDGWLFYDLRHSDPLAYRILKLDEEMLASRRCF
jgi:hypothetical protein